MKLGPFDLISSLSRGGMGEVFLARQRVLDRERLVILKTLLPQIASEPGFIEQFLDEARTTAALNHPNIVSVYDVGETDGVHYISMEFIRGVDLAKLRRRAEEAGMARIPLPIVLRIIHDAAVGFHYAHTATDDGGVALSVIHRDVSPNNLMIRIDGVVKIVDFGIAKSAVRASDQTEAGTLKGKLQYMSPEQVQGEELDARSDEFALGIVFWELLTGKPLFRGSNEVETLRLVLTREIPDPRELQPDVPEPIAATVMRMLQRPRDARFPGCDAVADAIRQYTSAVPEHAASGKMLAEFIDAVAGIDVTRTPTASQSKVELGLISGLPSGGPLPVDVDVEVEMPAEEAAPPPRRLRVGVAAGAATALLLGVLAFSLQDVLGGAAEDILVAPVSPTSPTSPTSPPTPVAPVVPVAPVAPIDAPVTPPPVDVEKPGSGTSKPVGSRTGRPPKRDDKGARSGKPDASASASAGASISLNAVPWAEVKIDGRTVGTTPLYQLAITAGRHEVVFTNPDLQRVIKRTVVIEPGKSQTIVVDLHGK